MEPFGKELSSPAKLGTRDLEASKLAKLAVLGKFIPDLMENLFAKSFIIWIQKYAYWSFVYY